MNRLHVKPFDYIWNKINYQLTIKQTSVDKQSCKNKKFPECESNEKYEIIFIKLNITNKGFSKFADETNLCYINPVGDKINILNIKHNGQEIKFENRKKRDNIEYFFKIPELDPGKTIQLIVTIRKESDGNDIYSMITIKYNEFITHKKKGNLYVDLSSFDFNIRPPYINVKKDGFGIYIWIVPLVVILCIIGLVIYCLKSREESIEEPKRTQHGHISIPNTEPEIPELELSDVN